MHFMYLFILDCTVHKVINVFISSCFKKSSIIPVPKKSTASCLNDYRPIALTSVVTNTFERMVLQFLKSSIDPLFARFQFAYREKYIC